MFQCFLSVKQSFSTLRFAGEHQLVLRGPNCVQKRTAVKTKLDLRCKSCVCELFFISVILENGKVYGVVFLSRFLFSLDMPVCAWS